MIQYDMVPSIVPFPIYNGKKPCTQSTVEKPHHGFASYYLVSESPGEMWSSGRKWGLEEHANTVLDGSFYCLSFQIVYTSPRWMIIS